MKILVCIKAIPAEAEDFFLNNGEGGFSFRINRSDEYAIEEALCNKDNNYDTEIDLLTVGTCNSIPVLMKALEKGADSAILINIGSAIIDSYVAACLVSRYVAQRGYDVIYTGIISEDSMCGAMGAMIASFLGIPFAVSVISSSIVLEEKRVTVNCERERGGIIKYAIPMPCVLSVQTSAKEPRYPSLSNKLKARTKKPIIIDAPHNLLSSLCHVSGYELNVNKKGVVLHGTTEEKAKILAMELHSRGLL